MEVESKPKTHILATQPLSSNQSSSTQFQLVFDRANLKAYTFLSRDKLFTVDLADPIFPSKQSFRLQQEVFDLHYEDEEDFDRSRNQNRERVDEALFAENKRMMLLRLGKRIYVQVVNFEKKLEGVSDLRVLRLNPMVEKEVFRIRFLPFQGQFKADFRSLYLSDKCGSTQRQIIRIYI